MTKYIEFTSIKEAAKHADIAWSTLELRTPIRGPHPTLNAILRNKDGNVFKINGSTVNTFRIDTWKKAQYTLSQLWRISKLAKGFK